MFYEILERKNAFLGYKNQKFKKSKNWDFSKGVNPWFWSKKWPFFQLFVFRQYRSGKYVLRYSRTKKDCLRYKNVKFKKSKNWGFSKGVNPWFWSKNGHFSNFLFLGSIAQENVFYNILARKTTFYVSKTRSWKSQKIEIFPKGLTHGFGPKMAIFPTLFF